MNAQKIQKRLEIWKFMDSMGNMNKKNIHKMAKNDAQELARRLLEVFRPKELCTFLKLTVHIYAGASNEEFIFFISLMNKIYELHAKSEGICFLWQLINTSYFKEYFDEWFSELYYETSCMLSNMDDYEGRL